MKKPQFNLPSDLKSKMRSYSVGNSYQEDVEYSEVSKEDEDLKDLKLKTGRTQIDDMIDFIAKTPNAKKYLELWGGFNERQKIDIIDAANKIITQSKISAKKNTQ